MSERGFGAGLEHPGPAGHAEHDALGAGRCGQDRRLRDGQEAGAGFVLHDGFYQRSEFRSDGCHLGFDHCAATLAMMVKAGHHVQENAAPSPVEKAAMDNSHGRFRRLGCVWCTSKTTIAVSIADAFGVVCRGFALGTSHSSTSAPEALRHGESWSSATGCPFRFALLRSKAFS